MKKKSTKKNQKIKLKKKFNKKNRQQKKSLKICYLIFNKKN